MQRLVEMEPTLLLIDVHALKATLFSDCVKDCQLSELARKNMDTAMVNLLFSSTPAFYLQSLEMPTWFQNHPYGGKLRLRTCLTGKSRNGQLSQRQEDSMALLISKIMDGINALYDHHQRREIELLARNLADSAKLTVLVKGKVPVISIGAIIVQAAVQIVPKEEFQNLKLKGDQKGIASRMDIERPIETILSVQIASKVGANASAVMKEHAKLFPASSMA